MSANVMDTNTSPLPEDRKVSFALAELLTRQPSLSTWKKMEPVRWHCVYVVRDAGVVLYVGSTKHGPMHRMKQHLRSGRIRFDAHLREVGEGARAVWTVEVYGMPSEDVARLVEAYAVAQLHPVWNDRIDQRAKAA